MSQYKRTVDVCSQTQSNASDSSQFQCDINYAIFQICPSQIGRADSLLSKTFLTSFHFGKF